MLRRRDVWRAMARHRLIHQIWSLHVQRPYSWRVSALRRRLGQICRRLLSMDSLAFRHSVSWLLAVYVCSLVRFANIFSLLYFFVGV